MSNITSPDQPSTRFQRRPDERPEELLDAALTVFGERGFRATTLEEVATRAGVSKGTVYLYFESKEALFRAVVEKKVIARLEASEEITRTHEGPIRDLLVQLITRQWQLIATPEIAAMSRVVQAELPQFPELQQFYFENVIMRNRRLFKATMARGVATGEFRAEAIDLVPMLVPSLIMHLHQRRSLFAAMDSGCPLIGAELDMVLSLVLHGILAPPSPTSSNGAT
jgi:AcrR family transcriptional regulator